MIPHDNVEGFQPMPWQADPYRLVNWWDMQRFSVRIVYWAGMYLERLKSECMMRGSGVGDQQFPAAMLHRSISDEVQKHALICLGETDKECDLIGMPISAETIRDARSKVELNGDRRVSYDWLTGEISNIQRLIEKEMKGKDSFTYHLKKGGFSREISGRIFLAKKSQSHFLPLGLTFKKLDVV